MVILWPQKLILQSRTLYSIQMDRSLAVPQEEFPSRELPSKFIKSWPRLQRGIKCSLVSFLPRELRLFYDSNHLRKWKNYFFVLAKLLSLQASSKHCWLDKGNSGRWMGPTEASNAAAIAHSNVKYYESSDLDNLHSF